MKVILGITGSIAAYKALELVRLIRKGGGEVKVVLTESARQFITPLTCQILADNDCYFDQFALDRKIGHVALAEWGEVMAVAPASANIIGKAANGIADDLLSTLIAALNKPLLFVPAMDEAMWFNAAVIDNVKRLEKRGCQFLKPLRGPLASGKIGTGRFPDVDLIHRKIETMLMNAVPLTGAKILITGGRTEEDLDPARIVTNRSSGLMALALGAAGLCRGAEVRLILGEMSFSVPGYLETMRVRTGREMLEELKRQLGWCDCLVMAAAIADYRPVRVHAEKIHAAQLAVRFAKTPDLLKAVAAHRKRKVTVGFSLETGSAPARARIKLKEKGLDLIVANEPGSLGSTEARARIFARNGRTEDLGKLSKWRLSHRILDYCAALIKRSAV